MPEWVAGYIGIPFRSHGRDRDGSDCWGLLRLVLADQFGIRIPSYDGVTWHDGDDRRALAEFMAEHKADWTPVAGGDERPGDAVLLRMMGHPIHVGIVVASGWMLHVEQGADSCIEPYLDELRWKKRIIGYYRYAG